MGSPYLCRYLPGECKNTSCKKCFSRIYSIPILLKPTKNDTINRSLGKISLTGVCTKKTFKILKKEKKLQIWIFCHGVVLILNYSLFLTLHCRTQPTHIAYKIIIIIKSIVLFAILKGRISLPLAIF